MIGKVVSLRNEDEVRVRRGYIGDSQVSIDPSDMKLNTEIVTERVRYRPRADSELERILQDADNNPDSALAGWLIAVRSELPNGPGVRLIPGALKDVLELSLRQIYIDSTFHLWEIGEPFQQDENFRQCGTIVRKLL